MAEQPDEAQRRVREAQIADLLRQRKDAIAKQERCMEVYRASRRPDALTESQRWIQHIQGINVRLKTLGEAIHQEYRHEGAPKRVIVGRIQRLIERLTDEAKNPATVPARKHFNAEMVRHLEAVLAPVPVAEAAPHPTPT